MGVNKVNYGNTTLIDLTDTTATANDVLSGKYFYNNAGVKTLGTGTGGGVGGVTQDENGYIILDDDAPSGGSITVESLSVTQNGTYTAPTGKAYTPVTVNVGGGGVTPEPWVRPTGWPDYDKIDISNEECIFFTYGHAETSDMDFAAFYANCSSGGGYIIERGYLSNGVWTVEETTTKPSGTTFSENLPTNIDYICYKIKPSDNNHITSIAMSYPLSYNGYSHSLSNVTSSQPLLERYGHLPYVTSFTIWGNKFIQSETESCSSLTSTANMFSNCYSIKNVNLVECGASPVTNMQNMFNNCYSLPSIDMSGFNTSNVTNMSSMFYNCCALQSIDISGFNTSSVINMSSMFNYCTSLPSIDISSFNTSSVTNMSSMFNSCYSLQSVDVSGFNTSNVTNMANMFYNCYSLQSIDISGFDTSEVTSMSSMFTGCYSLQSVDVSGFDTSEVTSMSSMFTSCFSLQTVDVSGFDTSKVMTMSSMFSNCRSLQYIDISSFDTSEVTSMSSMFSNCTGLRSINIGSDFYTSKVTNMANMFSYCYSLQTVDVSGFDTSSVTNMSYMFYSCFSLQTVDVSGFDTSKVTNMQNMFSSCYALQTVDVSGFDTSLVTNMSYMFQACYSLQSIEFTSIATVYTSQFSACSVVTAFIFDVSSVPTLSNTNAFSSNSFSHGQKILFPASLVDTAKAAANWSTYAAFIDAIPA